MKTLLLSTLVALVLSARAEPPAVDAARAAKIATDYIATLGPSRPYITSLTLESSALVKGTRSWVVRWSEPIELDGQREIGARVKLDGTLIRLVEDKKSARRRGSQVR